MASDYIFEPIETDWDAIQREAYDFIQSQWPDWVPNEGNLETWQIAALSRMVAEAMDVATDVPPAIFKYLGTSILGVPVITATPSTVDSTWTLGENPVGQTIPAGTLVGIEGADGAILPFEVLFDVDVPALTLATAAGEVRLRSQDEGAFTTGLGGVGYVAEIMDPLDWVDTITLTGVTVDGRDEEDDFVYLGRLRRRLTLMAPRPVTADDFGTMAVDIAAQNGAAVRATALDGYNPADATFDNEKMVAVALADAVTGANAPGAIQTAVDAGLQSAREVNFIVNVIDPTRTTVDVTFDGVAAIGYDPAEVEARAVQAVSDYLQPWNFGSDPDTGGGWSNRLLILRQDISAVLNTTIGFERWTSLTIGLNGGAQTAVEEYPIAGAAPLTQPGAIVGTVVSA